MSNCVSYPRSISVLWYLIFLSCTVSAQESCALYGSSLDISEGHPSGCNPYTLISNYCIGVCKSWTIPASPDELLRNPNQQFIVHSRCCAMADYENVTASIQCDTGPRNIIFKSATACRCEAHACMKDD